MWRTVVILVGLLGAGLGTPETPLDKNAWALLVTGSSGIEAYSHQASVCHSYHVILAEGIPAERIIVMMVNDNIFNSHNPAGPTKLINKPNGTNVFANTKIDYCGDDVTPENFLNVFKGDKAAMKEMGTGRVIESDNTTNIFVYIAAFGCHGVLGFPNDNLYAHDLHKALKEMNMSNRYNKLIMYVEASFSGSMFEGILEEDTRVFAMTSAARDETSYHTYCVGSTPPGFFVCLGDEFSVSWMERMDKERKGTFDQFFHQYQAVRPEVGHSHVQIYGDFSIGPNAMTPNENLPGLSWERLTSTVDSSDFPLVYYKHKVSHAQDLESIQSAQKELDNLVEGRKIADELMEEIVTIATVDSPHLRGDVGETKLPLSLGIFPCYKNLIANFKSSCFDHKHSYLLHHYYKLANICVLGLDTSRLVQEMPSLCASYMDRVKTTVL